MTFLKRLVQRQCRPEIMDDPGLDPLLHEQALRGLARINWISASDRILWPSLYNLARREPHRPLRILDVASGAGDVPIRLALRARRHSLNLEIHGGDISPTALELAKRRAAQANVPVTFFRLDILGDPILADYDAIISSLFLHHLPETQALDVLRKLGKAAGRLVLINDLRRCRLGYLLAWLGTRLLTTSRVARVDGPRSVEAAFTIPEVRALADRAGLGNAHIRRRWPCRYLLAWSRP